MVVEDGAGVAGANSYLSVEDADAYWADRNNSTWADASTADKEAALIEASQYLDATFDWVWGNPPWQFGRHVNLTTRETLQYYAPLKKDDQGLLWPRISAYDTRTNRLIEGVPQKVQDATAELSLEALSERLLPTQDRATRREQVGDISVEYMGNALNRRSYPLVTRMLSGLYWSSRDGGSRRLERV